MSDDKLQAARAAAAGEAVAEAASGDPIDGVREGEGARTDGSGTLRKLFWYFLRLGAVGFGGPIALVGYMQRDLVEQERWLSEGEYREGLAFSQLAPGPLAAQLAIYIGWLRGRALGATVVGVAFVVPSFLMVLVISVLYVRFGGLPWMRQLFYGIGAAVIAIIARSAYKLVRVTLRRDVLLWVLFAVNAAVTAWTQRELISVIVASGTAALVLRAWPRWWHSEGAQAIVFAIPPWFMATTADPTNGTLQLRLFWFFAKAGALVFGSGLAIVPFLYGGAVEQNRWLTDQQFLDAVAVSMITPGPVVITVAFIGYLVAGASGSVLAALGVFLPVYLSVLLFAPFFRRLSSNLSVRAFIEGVTAAATGAIAGAAIVLGRRAIIDVPTMLIAAGTLLVLLTVRRVPEPLVILSAGVMGLLAAAR